MELLNPTALLQEANFKMAMLYEENPNAGMFSIKNFFTGDEAKALIQTGLWMQLAEFLVPTEPNLYYRYIYNKNAGRWS